MKRMLPIILLLVILCGCGNDTKPDQTEANTSQPTQASNVHTYIPDSQIEQQTNGAVRQYDLEVAQIQWIAPIHGGVLVAEVTDETRLTILSGIDGKVTATAIIPGKLTKDSVWQVTPNGFAYYDAQAGEVVLLDLQLTVADRTQLPQDLAGKPAISPDGSQIFYCQDQTVYSVETDRKISRPVRTNTCKEQTLLGCYMNGAVVACRILDMLDQWSTLYISGEDGKLLAKDNNLERVYSSGKEYFALRNDGVVNQYIYGNAEASALQMNIADKTAYGALELGGIVGQSETSDGVQLSFYDLKKTAAVTLPAEMKIQMVAADSTAGGVWLLTEDGVLLHWQLQASSLTEDTDYSGPVYTADAPDTEGLKQSASRGDAIAKEHGVVIRVYERALVSNDSYDIQVEYQPAAINRALDELEALLKKFPPKFLYKSVAGQIRICIVRSIGGQISSAYHWHDGDPFIILSVGVDMEQAFLDAFAYVLDIHVLGNSSIADSWETLNPQGFQYGTENTVLAYLEGESRAFADRRGMQTVTDDRATVFYHAMQADNQEVFQSEIMQAKLLMLCKAIRDAWRLEQSPETFLWEQYLNQSLAYQG